MRITRVRHVGVRRLRRFFSEERGEVAPATYLATLPIALMFIFFALDVGLRKGARLTVEYAAFCAARAAAVYMPTVDGSCPNPAAAIPPATLAAGACLSAVANKAATGGLMQEAQIHALVQDTIKNHKVTVTLSTTPACGRNAVITATVSYLYGPELPYSPLQRPGGLTITASAQAMLQSVK